MVAALLAFVAGFVVIFGVGLMLAIGGGRAHLGLFGAAALLLGVALLLP
jgi:hypothetical protein